MRSLIACFVAQTALVACTESPRSTRELPAPSNSDSARFAVALALMTRPIDTTISLESWLHGTAHSSVARNAPPGSIAEYVCRAVADSFVVHGRRWVRSAVFYRPEPPAGESLPVDTVRFAERNCRLRAIALVSLERDSTGVSAVADSLSRRIEAVVGRGKGGTTIDAANFRGWTAVRTWSQGSVRMMLGIVPAQPENRDENNKIVGPPTPNQVVALTVAPHSGYDGARPLLYEYDLDKQGDAELLLESERIDSAIAWTSPALGADLRMLQRGRSNTEDEDRNSWSPVDSALIRVATAVRDDVPRFEPRQRAAAYLAADLLFRHAAESFLQEDSSSARYLLRKRLESLGVSYEHSPLGGVYVFGNGWLLDAYRADSTSRVGRATVLTLLGDGWGVHTACRDDGQGFDRVIEHGRAALARGMNDPLILYYLGLAYNDIVSLSKGSGDIYADAREFAPRAADARAQSIAHFRAALDGGLRDPRLRRHAWRAAVALMLGDSSPTRFFCVYD